PQGAATDASALPRATSSAAAAATTAAAAAASRAARTGATSVFTSVPLAAAAAAVGSSTCRTATASKLSTSARWLALLDALAPLCGLNFDYWIEAGAGSGATGGGGSGGTGQRPSLAAAAAYAARVGQRYGKAVPGTAAAALLHEPLLRCFSLQYIQALRRTPEA
ncbi:hypothetical protein Agub_g7375, partial [Astrephomene gubernaculifera]